MLSTLRRLALVIATLLALPARAQPATPPADWSDWAPLVGDWDADVTGPDAPRGAFSLAPELQGRVLVRHSFAESPKTASHPASRHDDLMIVHRDGEQTRADYWDNEGHLIRYVVTVDRGKTFTFVSEPGAGPRFRLVYVVTGPKTLALRFEIASPNAPERFRPYLASTLHRRAR